MGSTGIYSEPITLRDATILRHLESGCFWDDKSFYGMVDLLEDARSKNLASQIYNERKRLKHKRVKFGGWPVRGRA